MGPYIGCDAGLSYRVHHKNAWSVFDLTVEEGIGNLRSLFALDDGKSCYWLPKPNQKAAALLESRCIDLPGLVPKSKVYIDTRKKNVEKN